MPIINYMDTIYKSASAREGKERPLRDEWGQYSRRSASRLTALRAMTSSRARSHRARGKPRYIGVPWFFPFRCMYIYKIIIRVYVGYPNEICTSEDMRVIVFLNALFHLDPHNLIADTRRIVWAATSGHRYCALYIIIQSHTYIYRIWCALSIDAY